MNDKVISNAKTCGLQNLKEEYHYVFTDVYMYISVSHINALYIVLEYMFANSIRIEQVM